MSESHRTAVGWKVEIRTLGDAWIEVDVGGEDIMLTDGTLTYPSANILGWSILGKREHNYRGSLLPVRGVRLVPYDVQVDVKVSKAKDYQTEELLQDYEKRFRSVISPPTNTKEG